MQLNVDAQALVAWLQSQQQATADLKDAGRLETAIALAPGTGENQADLIWHAQDTLAAGADQLLDLTALSRSVLGASGTVQFAKVKVVLLRNLADTAGQVLQAGPSGTADGWTGPFGGVGAAMVELGPQGCWFQAAPLDGWNVSATSKVLKLHNPNSAELTYQIVLAGTSI